MGRLATYWNGAALLTAGAALVGMAIVVDGQVGRLINGVGGVLWFASAALLLIVAKRTRPPGWLWIAGIVLTIAVAFVVTPSALVPTMLGFAPAGFLMAWLAARSPLLWATMIPAWYLPADVGTAVATAAIRSAMGNEASLRADPPPTAAVVPLLMVICAMAGGYIAVLLARQRDHRIATGIDRSG